MNRAWAAVLAVVLTAAAAFSASPDPGSLAVPPEVLSKARELVRKLGSESFREREEATAELAKLGRLARPALVEGANTDPDPEVRFRCARLLPKADAADLQARVETFLADAEGKFEHDLPGWALFRREVGTDKAARDLYVEMLKNKANLDILAALDAGPDEGGRAIADRRLGLYLQQNPNAFNRFVAAPTTRGTPPTLPDVAALLLAESVVQSRHIPRAGMFAYVTGATFVQGTASMAAINSPAGTPHADPYRRILVKWFDTRVAPEDLNQVSYVANNLRTIPETTALLRRVVTTDGVYGYQRGQSLMFLVQRNGDAELPFLRSLVIADAEKDRVREATIPELAALGAPAAAVDRPTSEKRYLLASTVVTQVWFGGVVPAGGAPQQYPCQLRDVALAMLLASAKQNLRDYGYEFPPGAVPNPGIGPGNVGYGNYAFTSDEKREAAIKKWREFEAKPPEKK